MNEKYIVSPSPHTRCDVGTASIMRDVVIALLPALIAGIVIFGLRALIVVVVSVLSAVLSEHIWCICMKKKSTVYDMSAVVTGLLLAFVLPVSVPLYVPALGSIFAIIIVKELFGGLGNNFINPALAGRAFLLASFSQAMTTWYKPFYYKNADAVTGATPLNILKSGEALNATYKDLFIGNIGGCIGEVSAVALIIGFIYLLIRKVIRPHATLSYIISVGILGVIFGYNGYFTGDFLVSILTGGVMLGGIFMLTDYVTSPTTDKGNIVYGIFAAFVTTFIRLKGGYPEGVCYSILLANIIAPQLDKIFIPKKYGFIKIKKGGASK